MTTSFAGLSAVRQIGMDNLIARAPAPFGLTEGTRSIVQAGALVAELNQSNCCCLIERGLVATYVTVDRNRPTCVGLIGSGQMTHMDALFGQHADTTRHVRAVVSTQVLRVPLAAVHQALERSPLLRDACVKQLQAELADAQHISACNARHLLPARCAHWLLKLRARVGDMLPLTHEFLASVLGVRRAGVTVTLQGLQQAGAIRQQRGSIVVTDAERLRQAACSCPISLNGASDAIELPLIRPAAF